MSMTTPIPSCIAAARTGTNPAVICRVPSGWVVMCDRQYLRGYLILLSDPVVASMNDFDSLKRAAYLADMTLVGDALLEATNACRITYCTLGNSDSYLHTHIVPRYTSEPEKLRLGGPWSYSKKLQDQVIFDYERDKELMGQIAMAIQKRL
jgi:diadenosine tetraphosphate (Ap4A) HIT family hydrolase